MFVNPLTQGRVKNLTKWHEKQVTIAGRSKSMSEIHVAMETTSSTRQVAHSCDLNLQLQGLDSQHDSDGELRLAEFKQQRGKAIDFKDPALVKAYNEQTVTVTLIGHSYVRRFHQAISDTAIENGESVQQALDLAQAKIIPQFVGKGGKKLQISLSWPKRQKNLIRK